MNPYTNSYLPPYMQQMPQGQPIQQLPAQHAETRVMSYFVDKAEQLATINPMPNTMYLGINIKDGKIFMRRMNNDGLMEIKTYNVAGEETKKTDTQEILERIGNIERKLSIGGTNEPRIIDVTE